MKRLSDFVKYGGFMQDLRKKMAVSSQLILSLILGKTTTYIQSDSDYLSVVKYLNKYMKLHVVSKSI